MKLPLLLLLLLCSCRDQYPTEPDSYDAARIQGGAWHTQPPVHPLWVYEFNYPHLRQWIVDFGGVITTQEYIYAPKGDTLYISGAGGQRIWLVYFPNDTTAEYRQWDLLKWSPVRVLKRHF